MNGDTTENPDQADDPVQATGSNGSLNLQQQMLAMQKLMDTQLQLMQMQMNHRNITNQEANSRAVSTVKRATIPSGRYDMNSHEFRTYAKDCTDFKKLTGCTDEQTVLQMRMSMDTALKQAVDANYGNAWDNLTVVNALKAVGTLIKLTTNPVVYRKQFDGMVQNSGESVKEFITRLKVCAEDCDFVCPFDETHNLTEYHMINRVRSGVADKKLQQELLQKSDQLRTLKDIADYCDNYDTSQQDLEILHDNPTISAAEYEDDLSHEEVLAAISTYKKSKREDNKRKSDKNLSSTKKKCYHCGYDWPHVNGAESCPAKSSTCNKCNRKGHFESVCKTNGRSLSTSAIVIGGIESICSSSHGQVSNMPLVNILVGHGNTVPTSIEAVADTGAQATVAGPALMKRLGITKHDLQIPSHSLQHVGGHRLPVLGSYSIYILHNNQVVETVVYFVKGVTRMYLSLSSCKALCLIDKDFPLNNTAKEPILHPTPETVAAIVEEKMQKN